MEKVVHTSFFITKSAKLIALAISEKTGIKYKRLQTIMIQEFLKGDCKVNPRLENRSYKSVDYVKRTVREHIELSSEEYDKISEIAIETNVTRSSVMFQAMLDYCAVCAAKLWTDEEFGEIFKIEKKKPYTVD